MIFKLNCYSCPEICVEYAIEERMFALGMVSMQPSLERPPEEHKSEKMELHVH